MNKLTSEQLLEKVSSMKLFCLDNSFEIAFEKQFIVPYAGIDIVADMYPEYSGCAVYMVLQADKIIITDIDLNNDPPIIKYRNCATNEKHQIDNLWFFPFPIPKNALHMEIISDNFIEVDIKEEWRLRKPQWQEFGPMKLSIYDLIIQSRRQEKTISEYDLLYIGSSKDVYRRLLNHETIPKIHRYMASFRTNKELFIWILKPKSYFYKQSRSEFAAITLSSSVRSKDKDFGIDIENEHLLAISEAMLIHYFKPEYNKLYKNNKPNYSHVVYAKLYDAGVKHLQVHLNLFMQKDKELLSVKTENENTRKEMHISLHGALENLLKEPEDSIISVEVLPEELYSLFIGDYL